MQLRVNHFPYMMGRRIGKIIIDFRIMMVVTIILEMLVNKNKWEENPIFVEVRITWKHFV